MAVPDSIIASMIKFTNVVKDFRRARVLDGINLDIGIGERVALIGSNGAGKTTLIRCLLGEYTYGGEVAINGLDPRSNRTQVLGNIGFVPQLPPPLKMPVGQLIDFSASLCGTDPLRIHAIAKRLGLAIEEILSRQFVRLSGGMKQKLLIAIALGREAKVLVMDEPAANLDRKSILWYQDLVEKYAAYKTVIVCSNSQQEEYSFCKREINVMEWKPGIL